MWEKVWSYILLGIRKILAGLDNVGSGIDDFVMYTDDWKAHSKALEELFRRLQLANLTVKPSKCVFGSESIDFLGHRIGSDRITVNHDTLEIVRTIRRLTTKKEMRSFLGQTNYYRAHI